MYRIYYVLYNNEHPTKVTFETEAEVKKRIKWLNENVIINQGKYIYKEE